MTTNSIFLVNTIDGKNAWVFLAPNTNELELFLRRKGIGSHTSYNIGLSTGMAESIAGVTNVNEVFQIPNTGNTTHKAFNIYGTIGKVHYDAVIVAMNGEAAKEEFERAIVKIPGGQYISCEELDLEDDSVVNCSTEWN